MPMRADTNAAARRTGRSARLRTVRTRSVRALLGPGIAALYLAATWGAPHRPVMAAVAGTMLAAAGLTWWAAPVLARSRWRVAVQYAGIMVNIGGSAALSLLDGGVGSPLGAMVPFSLLFYAIMMPPRAFAVASTLSAVAYWTVAVTGEPVPPGYAEVYTLGVAGVAYLCFRHAAALASLRHRLAEASRVDPLTRCLNRRGFGERLEQAVAEAV